MNNDFYFILKTLFLRYLNFCSDFFGHEKKRLGKKAWVNLKIYDVTNWIINNDDKHIAKCLKKQSQSDNEISSVNRIEHNVKHIFLQKSYRK